MPNSGFVRALSMSKTLEELISKTFLFRLNWDLLDEDTPCTWLCYSLLWVWITDSLLENHQPDFIPQKVRFIICLPHVMAQQLGVTQNRRLCSCICPNPHPPQPFTAASQPLNCSQDGLFHKLYAP